MSFPETDAFAPDQRVGEFGNGQKVRAGALRHTGRVHLASAHDTREERQGARGVRGGAEHERLQIVFSVVDVAERRIVQTREDSLRLPQSLAGERRGHARTARDCVSAA